MAWAASTASRLGIHLVAGSFPERTGRSDGRLANTSCLVGPDGATLAVYRKIHLFDVALAGVQFRESDTIAPGDEPSWRRWRQSGTPRRSSSDSPSATTSASPSSTGC